MLSGIVNALRDTLAVWVVVIALLVVLRWLSR